MKKLFFICVVFGLYKGWDFLNAESPNYSQGNVVVLYATDWCGYCKKARELFVDNNIKYTEFDIEKSDEGRKQYDKLNGNGVPVININGNIVRGYNESKILRLLN